MFERKNRGVLSEHYNKLVDHASEASGSEEDFITLKRTNHDLPSTSATLPVEENTSNRLRRALKSKRGQLKYGDVPTRLVFDDDGVAHQLLEMKAVEEVFGGDDAKRVALEAGRAFGEKARAKMGEVDGRDKAEAREKRLEKKRRRKEAARAEHSVGDDGADGPTLAGAGNEDDRYVSPAFDLPSESEHDDAPPLQKRQKLSKKSQEGPRQSRHTILADEEALALALLRGR